MDYSISFKDIIGNELKVGDTVYACINGKLRERLITKIQLTLRGASNPYFGVTLKGQGISRWARRTDNKDMWSFSKVLGSDGGVTLVKKTQQAVA